MLQIHYSDTATTIATIWQSNAEKLAEWALQRLVNRTDVHGAYRSSKQIKGAKRNGKTLHAVYTARNLTREMLIQHFSASARNHLIGLHAADQDNQTLWGAVDIDSHAGEDVEVNRKAAIHWFRQSAAKKLYPLLLDSDGKGGFHLIVLFENKVDAAAVHHYLKGLTSDWESLGLSSPPEIFPKTPDVRTTPKHLGNWLRLLGKHPNRDHYTKVYDIGQWLEGAAAVEYVLSLKGNAVGRLPPAGSAPGGAGDAPGGNDVARCAGARLAAMTVGDVGDVEDVVTLKLSHKRELKRILGVDLYRKIIAIIEEHGPRTTRQREKCGFKVVQKIMGIRPEWALAERIHLAHLWHDLVIDIVGTKDKAVIVDHFVRCFDSVKYPGEFDIQQVIRDAANEPIPAVVRLLDDKNMERLVKVLSYLQRRDLSEPVEITVEQAGQIYGGVKLTGSRKLAFLRDNLRLLKLVKKGVPPMAGRKGRGTRYWYLPLASGETNEGAHTNENNASAVELEYRNS